MTFINNILPLFLLYLSSYLLSHNHIYSYYNILFFLIYWLCYSAYQLWYANSCAVCLGFIVRPTFLKIVTHPRTNWVRPCLQIPIHNSEPAKPCRWIVLFFLSFGNKIFKKYAQIIFILSKSYKHISLNLFRFEKKINIYKLIFILKIQ